jgi:very-short-patch-repair endonuclease
MTSPADALVDYARCAPAELVAATAESMVHQNPQLRRAVQDAAAGVNAVTARALAAVDGTSESGTEFLLRWRLAGRLPVPIRPQVGVAGVGRVDFVLGERLVVEVDGEAYHTDPGQFERDRRRDAALGIRGFRVLRFSYRQVMSDWPDVEGAVFAAVARGDAL